MIWTRNARYASFGVAFAWVATIALAVLDTVTAGEWGPAGRVLLGVAITSAVALIASRRTGPLSEAYRLGVEQGRREPR